MRFFADLHIHSRYSRATSREMTPESLWKWAQLKGIAVTGTGDFTHPQWLAELREKTEPAGNGLFRLRKPFEGEEIPSSCKSEVFFLLSAEISSIYRKNGKTRKVHSLIFAPDFAAAERINRELSKIGKLASDGRPILGLDARELLRIVVDSSSESMLVPAHAWTPHFSVFGSASGFDSLEECFEELTPHISAIETGLSSDPAMNWRLSSLDGITLISNSDAHSPARMGREANIFGSDISYSAMMDAIRTGEGFSGTVEFFPEEGKYHFDGHRACGVSLSPKESKKHGILCPVCGRKMTQGVMHRVDELADREKGFRPLAAPAFHSFIPLQEIVSEALGVGVMSKAVSKAYMGLLENLGCELSILMDIPVGEIKAAGSPLVAKAVEMMRAGNVTVIPGYDGKYGKVSVLEKANIRS
jgi:uncharacterized protein (TIGR00375 family)